MSTSLVAFDTDRIKRYVFATGQLRDIRGASALLDWLNRVTMPRVVQAQATGATMLYAHGGSGLFEVELKPVRRWAPRRRLHRSRQDPRQ